MIWNVKWFTKPHRLALTFYGIVLPTRLSTVGDRALYCCLTHLEQSATSRHFSAICIDFQEEAEAVFVQLQFLT